MSRQGRKRLSIDIPADVHSRLKIAAKKRNITLTRIVIRSLLIQLYTEEKYEKKHHED